jgi:hypothetical protein
MQKQFKQSMNNADCSPKKGERKSFAEAKPCDKIEAHSASQHEGA